MRCVSGWVEVEEVKAQEGAEPPGVATLAALSALTLL